MVSQDKYLGFRYNGVHSSSDHLVSGFQAFILNEGQDLHFVNAPEFTTEFSFPLLGDTSHLLGTTKKNKVFALKLLVKGATLAEYSKFLAWLKPGSAPANLIFDYRRNWAYNTVVSSIGNGVFTVTPGCEGAERYDVVVEVSFTTVGFSGSHYVNEDGTRFSLWVDSGDVGVPGYLTGTTTAVLPGQSKLFNLVNHTSFHIDFIFETASNWDGNISFAQISGSSTTLVHSQTVGVALNQRGLSRIITEFQIRISKNAPFTKMVLSHSYTTAATPRVYTRPGIPSNLGSFSMTIANNGGVSIYPIIRSEL